MAFVLASALTKQEGQDFSTPLLDSAKVLSESDTAQDVGGLDTDTTTTSESQPEMESSASKQRQQQDAAADAQMTMKLKAKLMESYRKLAESSANAQGRSKAAFNGVAERFEIYFVEVKDGAMHIVAKLGDKIVYVKAKVTEVVGAGKAHIDDAKMRIVDATGNVKGAFQNGYVYITTTVDGQVVAIKAKTYDVVDCVQNKVLDTYGVVAKTVDDCTVPVRTKVVALGKSSKDVALRYTAPIKSKALAMRDSAGTTAVCVYDWSSDKAGIVFQPLKPFYVKAHNGVTTIVLQVGDTCVLVQVKLGDAYTTVHTRCVRSIEGARAVVEGCVSPFANRAFESYTGFQTGIVTRVEHVNISLTNGVIYIKGKASDAICAVHSVAWGGINSTKQAVFDVKETILHLVHQVVPTLSAGYGKACDNIQFLGTKSMDGLMHIVVQVNDRVFVITVKITEMVQFVRSKSMDGLQSFADRCHAGKTVALQALEAAKAKAVQVTTDVNTNGRSLVSNPKARVTAASAAGGAVALGASGGAAGLLTGGALGVVCAVPAAFFTFGLSIPVGAFLGAGAGLCVGSAAGGTAGLVSGGAVGLGATHKDEIKSKAKAYKNIAAGSGIKLRASVMAAVGSTGGTII